MRHVRNPLSLLANAQTTHRNQRLELPFDVSMTEIIADLEWPHLPAA